MNWQRLKSEGVAPDHESWWARLFYQRPRLYVYAILVMSVTGSLSPCLSHLSFQFVSCGFYIPSLPDIATTCPQHNCCQHFKDFMALTWIKHITAGSIATILWLVDRRRFKAWEASFGWTKIPFIASINDILYSREVPRSRYWLILSSSFFDVTYTIFQRLAMLYIPISNIQWISNMIVPMSAFFTMMIPREAIMIRQWIAILFLTGAVFISAHEMYGRQDSSDITYGTYFAVAAAASKAIQVNIEHKLFRKYRYPPMKFMMFSGIFSVCQCAVYTTLFDIFGILDARRGFWMVVNNGKLFTVAFAAAGLSAFYNLSSAVVQKYTSAVHREIICMNAIVLTWVIEVCCGHIPFDWCSLIAEIVTVLGVIIHCNSFTLLPEWMDQPVTFGGFLSWPHHPSIVTYGITADHMEKFAILEGSQEYSVYSETSDFDDQIEPSEGQRGLETV